MGRYARNSIGQYAPVGAAADDLPGGATPTGKKTIDTTAEVDVASYATAQVVDENLVAGNIKKDVVILGTTGSYEGGGSSDFSTAEITLNLTYPEGVTSDLEGVGRYTLTVPQNAGGTLSSDLVNTTNHKIVVLLYQGEGVSLSWPDFEGVVGADTYYIPDGTPTCSGGVSYDSGTQTIVVTGDGTISGTMVLDE